MNEKEKDKFYWWARLLTADLNIPDAECQRWADFLEKLSVLRPAYPLEGSGMKCGSYMLRNWKPSTMTTRARSGSDET
jgi:hypothetical protein